MAWGPLRRWLDAAQHARRTGRPARFEFAEDAADGCHWWAATACPLMGEPARVSFVIEDVTDRWRIETEWSASLHERREILNTLPDILYVVDPSGHTRPLEPQDGDRHRVPGRSVAGPYPAGSDPPGRARRPSPRPSGRLSEEGSTEVEAHLRHRDGTTTPYQWTAVPIQDGQGRVIGLTGVGRDITALKRTEAALRESEQRLQAVLDGSPAAIFLKDLQGRYLLGNRRWLEVVGLTKEAALGKTDYDLYPTAIADAFRAAIGGPWRPARPSRSRRSPCGGMGFIPTCRSRPP